MVIEKLIQWIDQGAIPTPETFVGTVKLRCLLRSWNLYKAINLLLKADLWEDAAIVCRAMFELLINLEEVLRDDRHAEARADEYLRFQILTEYVHRAKRTEYNIDTGRLPEADADQIAKLDEVMRRTFPEFVEKPKKKGRPRWRRSWSGMQIAQLAQRSRNPLRSTEYDVMYRWFCEFAHSAPLAVMDGADLAAFKVGDDIVWPRKDLKAIERRQRDNLLEVLSMATGWLLQILSLVESVIPSYDPQWTHEVTDRVLKLHLVDMPPPRLELPSE